MNAIHETVTMQRISSAVRASQCSSRNIESFQEFAFNDARAVREAVNSGQRTLLEFVPIALESVRWRKWLVGRPIESDLVKEYYNEVTKTNWVDKLPAKTARILIFNAAGLTAGVLGAGVVGPALSVGLSAGDYFLLDRVAKGWHPNHFVEGRVKKFLGTTSSGFEGRGQ